MCCHVNGLEVLKSKQNETVCYCRLTEVQLNVVCVVASALFYPVVCWGSCIAARDIKKLNKVMSGSGSVLGCSPDTVEVVSERRMTAGIGAV